MRQEKQPLEIEAATLTSRADTAEDTAGDPGRGVSEEFGPGMLSLNVTGFDGREVIGEGAVPPSLE